jgi:hypothetical protein
VGVTPNRKSDSTFVSASAQTRGRARSEPSSGSGA